MPASALAIANRRRVTRTSASAFASLRSTTGERSLRIDSAVISLSSNQRGGNHEPDALGIARRQQESSVLTGGITWLKQTKHRSPFISLAPEREEVRA